MDLPPSWMNLQKQNRQNIFPIVDIRQIRWVVSGRRETKWTHWFPELTTWGSFQLQKRKGNPRGAQWAYRVGSLREAKHWSWRGRKPESREMHKRRVLEVDRGPSWTIHLSVYRCKLWGNFPSLGKEPPDVSKKKYLLLNNGQ